MAKNEEEEHELHVPTVNQSRDKERNLHFLEEEYQMGGGFSRRLPGRFLCFAPISSVSPQNRSKFDPIYHF